MSVHFGNSGQAAHRATAAREEDRQARAERVEAEGYMGISADYCRCNGKLPLCAMCKALAERYLRKPPHYAGDPFCECEKCRGKRKQRSLRLEAGREKPVQRR